MMFHTFNHVAVDPNTLQWSGFRIVRIHGFYDVVNALLQSHDDAPQNVKFIRTKFR